MKNIFILSCVILCQFFFAVESHAEVERTDGMGKNAAPQFAISIQSKDSITHLGSLDSFEITEAGTQAARFLLNYLNDGDREDARFAVDIYERIIPIENFGGEYWALQWFGEYFLADEDKRRQMLEDRYVRAFFDHMAVDDFAPLKDYMVAKYKLGNLKGAGSKEAIERERFLEDFLLFNNPRREKWEQTSKIMEVLKVESGMKIADVGSGPGYYSFRYSDMVGPEGYIYAIDTVKKHLKYIEEVADRHDISNIGTVHTKSDSIDLPENSVDLITMVSLYHIIYLTSMEEVKDRFVESIKKALRPDGRFVVVDNALVEAGKLPYHGPYIARDLIIAQLYYYGFDLVEQYQFIPQRYVLVFKQRQ